MGMFSPSNPIKPKMIGTPIWAEREAGFLDVAFEIAIHFPRAIVVEYKKLDDLQEFSRLYIVGPDGMPPPFMKGIWMELRKRCSDKSSLGYEGYEIDADGRITHNGMLARADESWSIIQQAIDIYKTWLEYPTIGNFDTVVQLHKAQHDICNFKEEEAGKWIETQIEECRAAIKEHQSSISKYEQELNEIYEKAADAMNLFEANGLKPNLRGYEKAKMPRPGVLDNVRKGKILVNTDGEVKVFPDGAKLLTVGDLVHDTVNSLVAAYMGYGKWELI